MEDCSIENGISPKAKNQCDYINHEYQNDKSARNSSAVVETSSNHVGNSSQNDLSEANDVVRRSNLKPIDTSETQGNTVTESNSSQNDTNETSCNAIPESNSTRNDTRETLGNAVTESDTKANDLIGDAFVENTRETIGNAITETDPNLNDSLGNAVAENNSITDLSDAVDNAVSNTESLEETPKISSKLVTNLESCDNNESSNNSAAIPNATLNETLGSDGHASATDHSEVAENIDGDANGQSEVAVNGSHTTASCVTKDHTELDGSYILETKIASDEVGPDVADPLQLPDSECLSKAAAVIEPEEPMEVDTDIQSSQDLVVGTDDSVVSCKADKTTKNTGAVGGTSSHNESVISVEQAELSLPPDGDLTNKTTDVEMTSVTEELSNKDNANETGVDASGSMDVDVTSDQGEDETDSPATVKTTEAVISVENETPSKTSKKVSEANESSSKSLDQTPPSSVDADKVNNPDDDALEVLSITSNEDEKDSNQNRNTEVLHIDENEDDSDIIPLDNEKDPFAQEGDVDAESSKADDKPKDATVAAESSSLNEIEELQSASKENVEVKDQKESIKTAGSANDGAEKEVVSEGCIIPDAMENDSGAANKGEITVTKHQIRKFDITPVRLEKLIDPSRLPTPKHTPLSPTTTKTESDTNKGSPTINRPQREAAKKADAQIKVELLARFGWFTDSVSFVIIIFGILFQEIVKHSVGEPEESEQTAVCSRCSRVCYED